MLVGRGSGLECSSDSTVPRGTDVPSVGAETCWSFREVGKEWEAAQLPWRRRGTGSRAWAPKESTSGLYSVSAANQLPDFD